MQIYFTKPPANPTLSNQNTQTLTCAVSKASPVPNALSHSEHAYFMALSPNGIPHSISSVMYLTL